MIKSMAERAAVWDAQYEIEHRKHRPVVHKVEAQDDARTEPAKKRATVFIGRSDTERDTMLNVYNQAGGKRGRGNKRNQVLHSDLTVYFFHLKQRGVKLPRRHLSAKACLPELLALLIKHGYLSDGTKIDDLAGHSGRSGLLRKKIHRSLERIFVHIASFMP